MFSKIDTEAIAGLIRRHLAEGIVLGDDVLRFLESTHGGSTSEDMAALLEDLEGGDAATLQELLFFPDESLQLKIESLMDGGGLAPDAVMRISRDLQDLPADALFIFPDSGEGIAIAFPVQGVEAFVDRLHLCWAASDAIRQAAAIRFGDDGGRRSVGPTLAQILVRLRNAALAQTSFQCAFLEKFFAAFPTDRTDYFEHLDFVLRFLSETQDGEDAYEALMGKKIFYFRQFSQARRAKTLFDKSNMETLIMTGVRLPHMDTGAAVRAMELIDNLALFLFGRTEHFPGSPLAVDLGDIPDTAGAQEISRLLSDGSSESPGFTK